MMVTLSLATSMSGCIGAPPPIPHGLDYGIPRQVLSPGEGASWVAVGPPNRTGPVFNSDISADGSLVALGLGGGNIELWSTNGSLVTAITLAGETDAYCGRPWGIVRILSPDRLLTLFDQCVRIYDRNGSMVSQSPFQGFVAHPANALSADGVHLATTDNESGVRVSNLSSGRSVPVPTGSLSWFGITPDARVLVTVANARGGETRFYVLGEATDNATLIATFSREGRIVFSKDGRYVYQDNQYNQQEGLASYFIDGGQVTLTTWSCSPATGEFVKPPCPLSSDPIVAGSNGGLHLAWVENLAARWMDDLRNGNVTCAAVIRTRDFEAPNSTRGFQLGPNGAGPVTNGSAHCRPGERFIQLELAQDGSALAISVGGFNPTTVHITTARWNSTAPKAEGRYV